MRWAWLAAVPAFLNGAWMVTDGSVALATGDYIGTELGPWAAMLRAVGFDPLSTAVKAFFVVYGLGYLAALGAYAWRPARFRRAFAILTAILLLYLIVGTVVAAITLGVVLAERRRAG